MLVYGVEEGIARQWVSFSSDYILSDAEPKGFGLSNDGIQRVNIFADVPW